MREKIKIPISECNQLHVAEDYIAIAKRKNRSMGDNYEEIYWFSQMENAIKKLVHLSLVNQYYTLGLEEFLLKWREMLKDYSRLTEAVLNKGKTG